MTSFGSLQLISAATDLSEREDAWKRRDEQDVARLLASARREAQQLLRAFQEKAATAVPSREEEVEACDAVREALSFTLPFSTDQIDSTAWSSPNEVPLTSSSQVRATSSSTDSSSASSPSSGQQGIKAASSRATLLPGDVVAVQRFGGSIQGQVIEADPGDDDVTVRLGAIQLRVKKGEVVFVSRGMSEDDEEERKRGKVEAVAATMPPVQEAEVQTSRNTVDVRGMTVDEALSEVDLAIQSRASGAVLFIIHGIGSGALRAAVLQYLTTSSYVASFKAESKLNIGCTIARIK